MIEEIHLNNFVECQKACSVVSSFSICPAFSIVCSQMDTLGVFLGVSLTSSSFSVPWLIFVKLEIRSARCTLSLCILCMSWKLN